MTASELLEKYAHERTACSVWTRVMGYHRPVASFNIGKRAEHAARRHFLAPVEEVRHAAA